ncbi:MAG: hypothetical protein M0030_07075 [Actinomycetota bacterium]|nr:hypothetical protein [Actinomycetota bacterium]
MNDLTGQDDLERRFRRLLAWYPREFRREHGEEMLAVLLAGAADGQRRPGLAASADLIGNALLMWLRPSVPSSARAVRAAVGLMYAGAVLEVAALVTMVLTTDSVGAAVVRREPAQWQSVHAQLVATEIAAALVVAAWVWLAWGNGHGRGWARAAFLIFFALTTVNVMGSLARDGATYAPADLTAGAVLWLVALAAAVLIVTPQASRCYQRQPAG